MMKLTDIKSVMVHWSESDLKGSANVTEKRNE